MVGCFFSMFWYFVGTILGEIHFVTFVLAHLDVASQLSGNLISQSRKRKEYLHYSLSIDENLLEDRKAIS